VRKTSVEDIAKTAGMAKGTFYQHFDSKETFFIEVIEQYHRDWFHQAELFFSAAGEEPLRDRVRSFIRCNFYSADFLALFKFYDEIVELILTLQAAESPMPGDLQDMEHASYERLLRLLDIDTQKVKPGVVHNYLHTVYFGIANEGILDKDCMGETFEALLDGLIHYIFGG
jgi:AcrR family transcriptional regulator